MRVCDTEMGSGSLEVVSSRVQISQNTFPKSVGRPDRSDILATPLLQFYSTRLFLVDVF